MLVLWKLMHWGLYHSLVRTIITCQVFSFSWNLALDCLGLNHILLLCNYLATGKLGDKFVLSFIIWEVKIIIIPLA